MGTYTSVLLSGSTAGEPLTVPTTSVTLHTAGTASGTHDEVHLWASNGATHDSELVIMFGSTAVGRQSRYTVPTKDGFYSILPGLRITSSLAISAFTNTTSSSTGVMIVGGYVNRIST